MYAVSSASFVVIFSFPFVKDGYNSLHISSQYGYVKVVRTLIKNNARLNDVTKVDACCL